MNITTKKIRFCDGRAVITDYCLKGLKEDEVLIKSRFSLISIGTELNALTGRWIEPGFCEDPGYQLTGDVVEKGTNVTGLSVGDRVVTLRNHAGYMIATDKPYDTLKIPDNVSYEEASFVPLASVAMHGVRRANIKLGEPVAVFGMGIVGNVALQLAKLCGAKPVIAVDLSDYRLELAKEAGADYVINPSKTDLKKEIDNITGNEGVQAVIEATGNAKVIDMAFKIASNGGRIIVAGAMPGVEANLNLHRDFLGKELSLIAAAQFANPTVDTIYHHFTQQRSRRMLLDMIGSGEINVKRMITHSFSYEKAPEVYEFLKGSKDADEKFLDPDELRKMVGVIFEWN